MGGQESAGRVVVWCGVAGWGGAGGGMKKGGDASPD